MQLLAMVQSIVYVLAIFLAVHSQAQTVSVTLQPCSQGQVIEGFGVSGSWWADDTKSWSASNRARAVDLLFNQTSGAGLTIFRHNIGAGYLGSDYFRENHPNRVSVDVRTSTGYFYDVVGATKWAPGTYDLDLDGYALNILNMAKARGATTFKFVSYSPPAYMTVSGKVSGAQYGAPNLRGEEYGHFANYLLDITKAIAERYGLTDVSLSPINEPDQYWGNGTQVNQEGCRFTVVDAHLFLLAVLNWRDARGLQYIDIEGPDINSWDIIDYWVDEFRSGIDVLSRLSRFTAHSYNGFSSEARAKHPYLKFSQSEYCIIANNGFLPGMDGTPQLMRVLQRDLMNGRVSEWSWWQGVSITDYADGLLRYYNGWVYESKRLWVMAHYARFVHYGARRIDYTVNSSSVLISAFIGPRQGTVVVVVSNPSAYNGYRVTFNLAMSQRYITDATRSLQSVAVTAGQKAVWAGSLTIQTLLFPWGGC